MLKEMGLTDAGNMLLFFASLDYSDLKGAQSQVNKYLGLLARKRKDCL